ncbi:heme-binding protein [Flavobacteriaceae bacterium]|jgi:hypothetical protein|nr:heme-binding protein [Flavobacteriaceae bacterium]MDB4180375.1 heme-binding protein [Flavobacteriaceae bacterium]MDB4196537.1 heme-binding protein [Flavobacteriaceae bacterium]MDB4213123.1 heme-binding protein [Flavobacteriaceae bacterium]MDC0622462.1 heme-binding protein [Flavobacteriaceae bacterium]
MNKFILLTLFPLFMFTQTYETQKYNLIDKSDDFEIRYYPKSIKARVISTSDSNNNFRKLFSYISGNNNTNEKIAMTTPVYMNSDSNGNSMDFVMPSEFNLSNIHKPNDKDVKIIESKAGYFATLKYGGYSNSFKVEANTNKLYKILKGKNIDFIGEPSYVSYNSPFKFFSRRNEIIIQINYSE